LGGRVVVLAGKVLFDLRDLEEGVSMDQRGEGLDDIEVLDDIALGLLEVRELGDKVPHVIKGLHVGLEVVVEGGDLLERVLDGGGDLGPGLGVVVGKEVVQVHRQCDLCVLAAEGHQIVVDAQQLVDHRLVRPLVQQGSHWIREPVHYQQHWWVVHLSLETEQHLLLPHPVLLIPIPPPFPMFFTIFGLDHLLFDHCCLIVLLVSSCLKKKKKR
jgi:hypothetical protein